MAMEKYLLDGRKVVRFDGDIIEWARQMNSLRRVAQDVINGYAVSTVFLGSDHGFGGSSSNTPIVFETMIFRPNGETADGPEGYEYQTRCCTYDEAEAMHLAACEYVTKSLISMEDTREYLKTVSKDT